MGSESAARQSPFVLSLHFFFGTNSVLKCSAASAKLEISWTCKQCRSRWGGSRFLSGSSAGLLIYRFRAAYLDLHCLLSSFRILFCCCCCFHFADVNSVVFFLALSTQTLDLRNLSGSSVLHGLSRRGSWVWLPPPRVDRSRNLHSGWSGIKVAISVTCPWTPTGGTVRLINFLGWKSGIRMIAAGSLKIIGGVHLFPNRQNANTTRTEDICRIDVDAT